MRLVIGAAPTSTSSCTTPMTTGYPCDTFNLTNAVNVNVTELFRYEMTQEESDYARAFCDKVGGGTYCYSPPSCHGCCLATAMIVCPEAIIKRCMEDYVCYQPDLRYASECRQVVDLVPMEARQYGTPINVTRSDGGLELRVPTANGATSTYVPRRCRGPFPPIMESHLNFMQERNLPEQWTVLAIPTMTTTALNTMTSTAGLQMSSSTTSTMSCYIY